MMEARVINGYTEIYVGGGSAGASFITGAEATMFPQFFTRRLLLPGESADQFREVTAKEREALEAKAAAYVRPPQEFIDKWVAAGGQWYEERGYFGLNGIDDIDYTEAMKIWRMSYHQHRKSWVNAYGYGTGYSTSVMGARYFCRTYFPLVSMTYEPGTNMQSIFYGNSKVEAVVIYGGYGNGGGHHNFVGTFRDCRALRRVVLTGSFGYAGAAMIHCDTTTFQGCVNLERIEGVTFWTGGSTLDLSMAPKFEIDCIEKLVAARSGDKKWGVNTIILHADTYAKVTDKLLEAAADENITITTP